MGLTRPVVVVVVVLVALLIAVVVALAVVGSRLAEKESAESANQKQELPTCDDIAIIGAGISGSYSAWRLRERNLSISMYEYSDRIGGKCYTVKLQGIPDVNVEMGAMRFKPLEHPTLNRTVTELGLDIVDFVLGYGGGGNTLYFLRGKHMSYDEIPTKAPYNIPQKFKVDLDTYLWNLFNNFTINENGLKDDLTIANKQKIRTIHGTELGMISRRVYDALYMGTEAIEYFADANAFRSDLSGASAANWLPTSDPSLPSETSEPNPVKTVAQGMQAIPSTMVNQFLNASSKHRIHMNHHLKSIRKSEMNYILSFQPTETQAGVTTELTGVQSIVKCAKKVVLGVSRMALQHIDWEGFRQPKIKDILDHAVEDVQAAKMYFGYDRPWYRNTSLGSQYHHAVSTTPLRQTYDFAVSRSTGRGVLNPSYTDYTVPFWRDVKTGGGPTLPSTVDGNMQLAMSNTSVYLARKFYAEAFNLSLDDVPMPESAVMQLWDQYPFGAAWYNWSPGYKWEETEAAIMKPSQNDNVFVTSSVFSGDQLSDWTEGGLRMVEKMLKVLG